MGPGTAWADGLAQRDIGHRAVQIGSVSVAPATAGFGGEISDAGVDTDGDGRFDQLLVEVGVEMDVAAGYRLHGTLFDGSGATIEQVTVDVELSPGAQTVPLAFDGGGLFAAGADGPYLLDDLVIKDLATGIGLARGPAYTTAAYAHTTSSGRCLCC